MLHEPSYLRDSALWSEFHRLWSRDVGTEGYDKERWKRLERLILAVIAERAALEAEKAVLEAVVKRGHG